MSRAPPPSWPSWATATGRCCPTFGGIIREKVRKAGGHEVEVHADEFLGVVRRRPGAARRGGDDPATDGGQGVAQQAPGQGADRDPSRPSDPVPTAPTSVCRSMPRPASARSAHGGQIVVSRAAQGGHGRRAARGRGVPQPGSAPAAGLSRARISSTRSWPPACRTRFRPAADGALAGWHELHAAVAVRGRDGRRATEARARQSRSHRLEQRQVQPAGQVPVIMDQGVERAVAEQDRPRPPRTARTRSRSGARAGGRDRSVAGPASWPPAGARLCPGRVLDAGHGLPGSAARSRPSARISAASAYRRARQRDVDLGARPGADRTSRAARPRAARRPERRRYSTSSSPPSTSRSRWKAASGRPMPTAVRAWSRSTGLGGCRRRARTAGGGRARRAGDPVDVVVRGSCRVVTIYE